MGILCRKKEGKIGFQDSHCSGIGVNLDLGNQCLTFEEAPLSFTAAQSACTQKHGIVQPPSDIYHNTISRSPKIFIFYFDNIFNKLQFIILFLSCFSSINMQFT